MCETAFRLLENRRFSFFIVFGFLRVPLDFKSGHRLFFRCSGGRHENGVRGGPLLRNMGGRFSNSGFVSASTAAQARTAQHALPRLSESVLKPLHVLISSRHIKSPPDAASFSAPEGKLCHCPFSRACSCGPGARFVSALGQDHQTVGVLFHTAGQMDHADTNVPHTAGRTPIGK